MKSGVLFAAVLSVLASGGGGLTQTVGQDRRADRFLADFDLNHDGKVTRDEMAKADGARFASVAHGASFIGQEAFVALRLRDFQQNTQRAFRRLDWNGDGKLSLDEYAGPRRARFETYDRDGTGRESCAAGSIQKASFQPRGGGHEKFCVENDLNHDGSVTHAELDGAMAKRFAALTGNANAMTPAQFAADAMTRYRATNLRFFQLDDADHDGKLSLAEFSAYDLKRFMQLDKNKDGVVTREELSDPVFSGNGYKRAASRG